MADTQTPADVAATVKHRLKAAGISDAVVATEVGIRRQTINRRLNGHAPLDTRDLVVIAGLLGITVEALVSPVEDVAA
jgi:transcriptional regulator with XRE-family HTH domain